MNQIQPAAGTALSPHHADLVAAWLHFERVEGLSDNTLAAYQRGLKIFAIWLRETGRVTPETPIQEISAADVRHFRHAMLTEAQHAPQSVNLYLAAVRSFFRFLINTDRLQHNPADAVKGARRAKSTRHKREALTASEVRAVLETCDGSPGGIRDRAMITLMAYCALRTVEVHRADVDHLHTLGERLVLDVWGKGRTEPDEIVVIPVSQESVLRAWITQRARLETHDAALFVSLSNRGYGTRLTARSIRKMVMRRFALAGVTGDKTTHSLRHTAITAAILAGASPMQVRSMARHESFDTTLNYIHEVSRVQDPAEDYIEY